MGNGFTAPINFGSVSVVVALTILYVCVCGCVFGDVLTVEDDTSSFNRGARDSPLPAGLPSSLPRRLRVRLT